MAEATRARVQAAIGELGFVRNENARRLRQGRGRTLAVVVRDIGDPYFADLGHSAEAAMNAGGFDALWCTSDGSAAKEQRCVDFLVEQRVSGLIITPVALDAGRIAELRDRGLAVVLLDRTDVTDACAVGVDHVAGGELAAGHLLGGGDPGRPATGRPGTGRPATGRPATGRPGTVRLAFVSGPLTPGPARDRRTGVMTALHRAGLGDDALITIEQPTATSAAGHAAARALLALEILPDAVACGTDLLAVGLVNELLHAGVRVPGDVRVVGYDDIELAATAVVPLTTVRQPRRELGRIAAELAMAETGDPGDPDGVGEPDAADGHEHQQVVVAPELVIRESA